MDLKTNIRTEMKPLVVISGGSSDTGRAVAVRMARSGWYPIVGYFSNQQAALQTIALLKVSGLQGECLEIDVRSAENINLLRERILSLSLPLKGLVNIASFCNPQGGYQDSLSTLSLSDMDNSIQTDLLGGLRITKSLLSQLKAACGSVIHFGSASAMGNDSDLIQYLPAKLAISGCVRALARSLAPEVRINCIAPGALDTAWLKTWALRSDQFSAITKLCPTGRLGSPDDVSALVEFLLSNSASYITGQTIIIDGGLFCP